MGIRRQHNVFACTFNTAQYITCWSIASPLNSHGGILRAAMSTCSCILICQKPVGNLLA